MLQYPSNYRRRYKYMYTNINIDKDTTAVFDKLSEPEHTGTLQRVYCQAPKMKDKVRVKISVKIKHK